MAKFFGAIGFAETIEARPGVYIDRITERNYYGELIRNTSRWTVSSESANDDLNINNQVSIHTIRILSCDIRCSQVILISQGKVKIPRCY